MKTIPYFDIHDGDVTEIIYHLLFSIPELVNGNDRVYKIRPWGFKDYTPSPEWEKEFQKCCPAMNRCYSGHHPLEGKSYEDRVKNVPTLDKAIDHFWAWLKEHGVTEKDEEITVKLWW